MESEFKQLEEDLGQMEPMVLSKALSNRLVDSMNQASAATVSELETDLLQLEAALSNLSANAVPSDMLQRLDSAMSGWNTDRSQEEENVIPFNAEPKESRESWWSKGMVASAAAVAILGAMTALLGVKSGSPGHSQMASSMVSSPSTAISVTATPRATASKNIISTSDQGVVYSRENKPHRCMKVEYLQKVELKNQKGERVQVEQPMVEYLLVPLKTD